MLDRNIISMKSLRKVANTRGRCTLCALGAEPEVAAAYVYGSAAHLFLTGCDLPPDPMARIFTVRSKE